MTRREFTQPIRKAAWARCNFRCEGELPDGSRCSANLEHRPREFFELDHDLADWFGGPPTLENCRVLCVECHKDKTKNDIRLIAKSKRIYDKHNGIKIKSRGFPRREPQRTATRPIRRKLEDA